VTYCVQYTKMTNTMRLCTLIYHILFLGCSTCFERYFRSSSGASKLYYSFWYYTRMSLPAGITGVLELTASIMGVLELTASIMGVLELTASIMGGLELHVGIMGGLERLAVIWECWN
jgi:hypothetical protein